MKSLRLKTTLNIDTEIVYKESQLLQHIGSQTLAHPFNTSKRFVTFLFFTEKIENTNSNYKLLPIKVPLYEFIKLLIIWLEKSFKLITNITR